MILQSLSLRIFLLDFMQIQQRKNHGIFYAIAYIKRYLTLQGMLLGEKISAHATTHGGCIVQPLYNVCTCSMHRIQLQRRAVFFFFMFASSIYILHLNVIYYNKSFRIALGLYLHEHISVFHSLWLLFATKNRVESHYEKVAKPS